MYILFSYLHKPTQRSEELHTNIKKNDISNKSKEGVVWRPWEEGTFWEEKKKIF